MSKDNIVSFEGTVQEIKLLKNILEFIIRANFIPPDYTDQELHSLVVRLRNAIETKETDSK